MVPEVEVRGADAAIWGAGAVALASAALSACGGGSDSGGGDPPAGPLTREQASRVLAQGAFGGTSAEIDTVRALGVAAWIEAQFALPRSTGHVAWMRAHGYADVDANGQPLDQNSDRDGVERSFWRKLISSPDVLRQRMVLALSEIFVVSIIPVVLPWRGFAVAAFVDLLETHAFGNYRALLRAVSTNPAMGRYLTFLNNAKADPATGSAPDENYAREVIQLFTLGVLKLGVDGRPVVVDGVAQETYTQTDITQMARVFTGWVLDQHKPALPAEVVTRPLIQNAAAHERGTKVFLGTTIDANTNGSDSLDKAIDTLMTHPNIAPFIGRQLIQRFVTSNPSPDYVKRVATAFIGDGEAGRGDLKATLRAVLTDPEAFSSAGLTSTGFGKLREPVLRLVQWARTFGIRSADDTWAVGNLTDPATELGQSPLRSPSVFNFFRPGFVPQDAALGAAGITAPEFQITTESSVAGYLNYMQRAIFAGVGGMPPDVTPLMPLAGDSAALLAELNVLLAAGQLSPATLAAMKTGLDSIDASVTAGRTNRIRAATMLVMAAPEYLVQK